MLDKYTPDNIQHLQFKSEDRIEDCEFHQVDFSTISLKSVSFLGCAFKNCNLANQSLLSTSLREVVFEDCNLIGINWCALKSYGDLKFISSKLDYGSFQKLNLKKTEFLRCSLIEADFSEAELTQCNFSDSDLAGANFEGANLSEVDFRTSLNYLFDIRKARIKGAKFSYPHVLTLLTALGAKIE